MHSPSPNRAKKTVLVVDDEAAIRDVLQNVLSDRYRVIDADTGDTALTKLIQETPDLILLDLMMPDISGLELLSKIRAQNSLVPVIVLTGTTSLDSAVEAMRLGAADYLAKPFEVAGLELAIERATATQSLVNEVQYLRKATNNRRSADIMVGESPPMLAVLERINQVANTTSTVLVTGESGTGKELVARALHLNSDRKNQPFIALNCAAIPETLIEAELFGHEKGAFTSATGKRVGHFELADGGTLFLDELGDLSLATQAKLLRVLQEREFTRVGGSRPISVDVRLVAATNKNLEKGIADGTFREDLYYRLNVFPIQLPPLRERTVDIATIAEHFVMQKTPPGQKPRRLAQEAIEMLSAYHWPGNIREMENVLEQTLILAQNDVIRAADLPSHLSRGGNTGSSASRVVSGNLSFDDAVAEFEREMIIRALNETGFVQTRAATALGITRRVLKYKMDQLGIPARPTYAG